MTFFEYLKEILNYPISGSVFDGFFKAIGNIFDTLKEAVYHTRNQFIAYISNNIERFADERGVQRFPFETTENYHKRILYAFSFTKNASNHSQFESLLKMLTKKPFIIKQITKWRLGMSKLSINTYLNPENRCIVEFLEKLTEQEKQYIFSVLRFYLPAHIEIYLLEPQEEVIRWKLNYSLLSKNTILKED